MVITNLVMCVQINGVSLDIVYALFLSNVCVRSMASNTNLVHIFHFFCLVIVKIISSCLLFCLHIFLFLVLLSFFCFLDQRPLVNELK